MAVSRLRSRWLVAWDGRRQRLVPEGELVFEGDTVLYVGTGYPGPVDVELDASRALVAPGFVDLHVHAGALAAARLYSDAGRREPLALGFLNYAAPREDAAGPGPIGSEDAAAAGLATLAELLRYGSTTAVEVGGETGVDPVALAEQGAALGIRLVLGRGFRSSDYRTRPDGTVGYRRRPDGGRAGLEAAVAFAEEILERGDPRLGAMLFALQADTCDPELLGDAYRAAERLGIKLQLHAAQGLFEVHQLMQRSGSTPVGYLAAAGALGPATLLAHAVFLSGHPWLPYAREDDLERLAEAGAGVVHCPVAFARRGIALDSFERYRRAGVPIAIGTDTFPRDMIQELRWASYLSKIQDRDFATADAWTVFSAATDVAADLLGRPDLGRLGPGRRADFLVIDLDGWRTSPVFDPISSLVHAGTGEDVRDVYVAGEARVRAGRVLGVDSEALLSVQERAARHAWGQVADWHPQRLTALDVAAATASRLWDGEKEDP